MVNACQREHTDMVCSLHSHRERITSMMRLRMPLLCLGMLIIAVGCSRGPEFAEVEGKLVKGGTPLKNVRVEFWPEIDGPKSTGVTDSEGRYTLKSEDGKTIGAVV